VNTLAASAISKPPPVAPKVIARGVDWKLVPVTCRVPPSKSRPALAAPRFVSALTDKVPALSMVPCV